MAVASKKVLRLPVLQRPLRFLGPLSESCGSAMDRCMERLQWVNNHMWPVRVSSCTLQSFLQRVMPAVHVLAQSRSVSHTGIPALTGI